MAEPYEGAFDNLNDIIAAINDCSGLLELNISSTMNAGTKLGEMQQHLAAIGRLRRDLIIIIKGRLEDAAKVRQAMKAINGDSSEPDGNLQLVASMMELIEQGGLSLNDALAKLGQATELVGTLVSSIDRRTQEIVRNQIAGKAILDKWTIV